MGCFYLILIVVGVIVVRAVIEVAVGGTKDGKQGGGTSAPGLERPNLRVKVAEEKFTLPSGDEVDVYRFSMSGLIHVPRANSSCQIWVRLWDRTGDLKPGEPGHVLCEFADVSDSDGCFEYREETNIPYTASTLQDYPLLQIPPFALTFPRRGTRTMVACVQVRLGDTLLVSGETKHQHRQNSFGYLEIRQRDVHADQAIVALALCVSAADGYLGRSEGEVIRAFCTARLSGVGSDNLQDRKDAVNRVFSRFREKYKGREGEVERFWKEACKSIRHLDSERVKYEAYELCVHVMASDGTADEGEMELLRATARELEISDEWRAEIHDRLITPGMVPRKIGPPSLSLVE